MKMKLKRTSLILVVVLLMSTMTAFAGTMEDLKKDPDNILVSGTVSDIRENKEGWTVSIDNDNMGMVFHIKENLPVYEGESGKDLSFKDIAVGNRITAVVDGMAPMTMSIPPQTAGAVAFIVESGTPETLMTTGQVTDKYVSLRTEAEAKGYQVVWTSHTEPIKITKDDKVLLVTIGSKEFTYTHMTRDLQPLDRMEALSMIVKLEEGKTMVPSSLIEALQ